MLSREQRKVLGYLRSGRWRCWFDAELSMYALVPLCEAGLVQSRTRPKPYGEVYDYRITPAGHKALKEQVHEQADTA